MKREPGKAKMLKALANVPIVQIACNEAHIARATYYRWRKEDETFAKAADESLAEGFKLMNDVAESQLLQSVKEQNIGAISFWLRHRHPAYAAKLELGGSVEHKQALLPDQVELIRKALRLATFTNPKENNHDTSSQ